MEKIPRKRPFSHDLTSPSREKTVISKDDFLQNVSKSKVGGDSINTSLYDELPKLYSHASAQNEVIQKVVMTNNDIRNSSNMNDSTTKKQYCKTPASSNGPSNSQSKTSSITETNTSSRDSIISPSVKRLSLQSRIPSKSPEPKSKSSNDKLSINSEPKTAITTDSSRKKLLDILESKESKSKNIKESSKNPSPHLATTAAGLNKANNIITGESVDTANVSTSPKMKHKETLKMSSGYEILSVVSNKTKSSSNISLENRDNANDANHASSNSNKFLVFHRIESNNPRESCCTIASSNKSKPNTVANEYSKIDGSKDNKAVKMLESKSKKITKDTLTTASDFKIPTVVRATASTSTSDNLMITASSAAKKSTSKNKKVKRLESTKEITKLKIKSYPHPAKKSDESTSSKSTSCTPAKETTNQTLDQKLPILSSSLLLSCSKGRETYSPLHCFARKNLAFFACNRLEAKKITKNFDLSIVRGQVGIRCIHCMTSLTGDERKRRTKKHIQSLISACDSGAIMFPSQVAGIYDVVKQFIDSLHWENNCELPAFLQKEYQSIIKMEAGNEEEQRSLYVTSNAFGRFKDLGEGKGIYSCIEIDMAKLGMLYFSFNCLHACISLSIKLCSFLGP